MCSFCKEGGRVIFWCLSSGGNICLAAQPRVERNGFAAGNAVQKIKQGVLPRTVRVKNTIRTRRR